MFILLRRLFFVLALIFINVPFSQAIRMGLLNSEGDGNPADVYAYKVVWPDGTAVISDSILTYTPAVNVSKTIQTISLGDTGALTPTIGYGRVDVALTCTADPSAIVMTEGGSEEDLSLVYIINVGSNECTFADNPGVVQLPYTVSLEQYRTLVLQYKTDRWVGVSITSDTLGVSSINLQTGAIQGAFYGTTDANGEVLTASEMNAVHTASGAGDWDIPADMCDTATRQWLVVASDGANAVSITSNDAADKFKLFDGTETDAADELDLGGADGDFCYICCMATNEWWVMGENGTCADGGAAD